MKISDADYITDATHEISNKPRDIESTSMRRRRRRGGGGGGGDRKNGGKRKSQQAGK